MTCKYLLILKWFWLIVFCFVFHVQASSSSIEIKNKKLKNTEVSVFVYEKGSFYLITEGEFSKKGLFSTVLTKGKYYFIQLKGASDKMLMFWGDSIDTKVEVNTDNISNSIIKGSPQNVFMYADYKRTVENDTKLQLLREQFLREYPDCDLADVYRLAKNFENKYFSWYTIPGENIVRLKENYHYDSLINNVVKVGDEICQHPVYMSTVKEVFIESEKDILHAKLFLSEILKQMNSYDVGYDFLCKELFLFFKNQSSHPYYDALYLLLLEKYIINKNFSWLSSSDSLNSLYEVQNRSNTQLYTYAKDIPLRDSTFKRVGIFDAVSQHDLNLVLFWNPRGEGYWRAIDSLRNDFKDVFKNNDIGVVLICTNKDKGMWLNAVSRINEPSWVHLQDRLELKVLDDTYLIKDKKPWIFLMTREALIIGSRYTNLELIEADIQYYQKHKNMIVK